MSESNRRRSVFALRFAAAGIVCAAFFVLALAFGAAKTSFHEIWLALFSSSSEGNLEMIREIRLPRVAGAMLIGAALAVAGAAMQGMTRNPLADPGLLGLTAGANAALTLAMALFPGAGYSAFMLACLAGAAAGSFLAFGLASLKKGNVSPGRMVLAGAAVSAFLYAVSDGVALRFKIARETSLWKSGGLVGADWSQVRAVLPLIAAGLVFAMLLSRPLNVLSLNEETAVGLGQKTAMIRWALFFVIVLLSGASVALAGNLAFIGLMVPHVARSFVGTDYRHILPISAIGGASFMMAADLLARTVNAPYETPVMAIAAVVGLPFFLLIVRRKGRVLP
ncbi:FecCD family ABC transporter permease [Cohnella caldifontis]|uniref:FecCD family ABC transporter permease n=1 Tax=Cohnella caldifontis TaxID=3027471 RepID=UPI0023EB1557|nr:iron ABC transporter permease [Cohnella sp. YIM B05605]